MSTVGVSSSRVEVSSVRDATLHRVVWMLFGSDEDANVGLGGGVIDRSDGRIN